ncbi:restriction endonuclease subunit S [Cronobacter dublinensis]|uniref:restriction endonuclease subunit S n=1 Tax=Cronobacter dublinensis TaxID=413497 RepID=UPI0024ADF756|nr:restriction endonuclease subunit S [Cronobacter dublinensis]MDI6445588.1 restriction endonuclease subunit S [Cronobacter dublinensis]
MVGYRTTVPSLQEQSLIASFLDHKTAKIDSLIEKQQQLIELLKEKRQAVISHAVTKGLNPDVPMKDSGVEWLGYISQGCIVTKLKYVTVLKAEKKSSKNTRYVGMENISSNTGKFLHKDEVSSEGSSVSFERGDILFGKLRPYLAKSWLATFSGVCSSEFLVFQSKKTHAKYLNYYLLTNEFIKQVDSSTYGSKMPRANWEFINQLPVPTWSYEESKAISVYLDNLTAKLDWLLEKQQQQIKLLQERRIALISAAVTGKIDVRDWRAPDARKTEEPQEATI